MEGGRREEGGKWEGSMAVVARWRDG